MQVTVDTRDSLGLLGSFLSAFVPGYAFLSPSLLFVVLVSIVFCLLLGLFNFVDQF